MSDDDSLPIRLDERLKSMEARFVKMETKVDEMHALLQQARGARWAILGMAAIGGFVSAKLAWLLPLPWGK